MTDKKSALDTQCDGDHYKVLKMQPIELAYRVNGSPCFTKLCKYASRRKVDRLGDLKKAIHCIQIEKELVSLTSNDYLKIRVNPSHFHHVLKQFTEEGVLYEALSCMYYGDYDSAEFMINKLIIKEFPDET